VTAAAGFLLDCHTRDRAEEGGTLERFRKKDGFTTLNVG
jgi:hypothetical protein